MPPKVAPTNKTIKSDMLERDKRLPGSPERPISAKPLDPNFTDTFPKTQSTYFGPTPSDTNRSLFMKKGGKVGESKKMVKQEVEFFKKKGASKLARHEEKELTGMKRGGGVKKMAKGGMSCMKKGGGIERKGSGPVKKFAKGGSIDGCAQRGKTRGRMC
jgi:hypothetical protein